MLAAGQSFTCPVHSVCPERKPTTLLVTDTNSSELIKHASNIVDATRVALETQEQHDLLVGRGNTKQTIDDRFTLMKTIVAKAAGF